MSVNYFSSYNMSKNQLFKKRPSDELFTTILNAYGFINLQDKRSITRNYLKKEGTVTKINNLRSELEKFYLPCKARTYLNGLTEKNIITILRQILKTRDYTITSREKYIRGEKFINYKLDNYESKVYNPIISKNNRSSPIIISFK